VRSVAQHEIPVGLEGIGSLRAVPHPYEPRIHRARCAADRSLEDEVALCARRCVLLERAEVVHLGRVTKVRRQEFGTATLACQYRLVRKRAYSPPSDAVKVRTVESRPARIR